MLYENPNSRRVRKSHILFVSCGYCKTDIAQYQKVGRGNLLRMHVDRIVKGAVDFSTHQGALLCPGCGQHLGTRIPLKHKGKDAYRMVRSAFNTREADF